MGYSAVEWVSNAVLERHGRQIAEQTVLAREGEPSSQVFFIRKGRVRLLRRVAGENVCLATLGPGEFFGELGQPAAACSVTAVADANSLLVAIEAAVFEQILAETPELSRRLLARLGARLQAADQRLAAAMTGDGPLRVAQCLLKAATGRQAGSGGPIVFSEDVDEAWLASQAGVLPSQAVAWLDQLVAVGAMGRREDGRFWIGSLREAEDFVEYCERKRRLDPLTIEELAELSGMARAEAEVLAERVASKRLSLHDPGGSGPVVQTPLQRYLGLKLRFEFQRGAGRPGNDREGSA